MGYSHHWYLDSEFTEGFLKDVSLFIKKYEEILTDLTINTNQIRFNGLDEYGYETFIFKNNYGDWCKTDIRKYDEAICGIFLLATYHFGEKCDVDSSGLVVRSGELKKETLGGYWEDALNEIEKMFGYTFSLERKIHENEEDEDEDEENVDWWSVQFIPNKKKTKV